MKNITFVFNEITGGIATMNFGIIKQSQVSHFFNIHLVLISENNNHDPNFIDITETPNYLQISYCKIDKFDNFNVTLFKLHELIEKFHGLVITNDGLELEAISKFGTKQIIYHIVHDLYNLKLAINYRDIIDYFICHTIEMTKILGSDPNLRKSVFFLPFGIEISENLPQIKPRNKRLQIVSLSRITRAKGIHHLIKIENLLESKGIEVNWVIIGKGEDETFVKSQWEGKKNVEFIKPTNEELKSILLNADIFISLSEFEGYGIALLEAMASGLVPIITKLPIGIHNMVPNELGLILNDVNFNNISDFINKLNLDRVLLASLKNKNHQFVSEHFNSLNTGTDYLHTLRTHMFKRTNGVPVKEISNFGFFDKAYIPNGITRILKKIKKYAIN
jgi:glycosyltransferase involved in cell wall biosynthesis